MRAGTFQANGKKLCEKRIDSWTWGDQALVSKAHSFIFNRGLYTLSYTWRIIGDAKSAVFNPYQKPGFLFCKFIVYKWFR